MEPNEGQNLSFLSWNVRGIKTAIHSVSKFECISEELSRQGAKIVFLQETHIGHKDSKTLLKFTAGWQCFYTVYDLQSKGVAILIKDDVPFQYICHDEDYSGGYFVLFCHLHGELFTLVNVYNHKDEKDMLKRLQEYLRETAEGVLVIGGDFNIVLNHSFDRNSTAKTPKPQCDIFKTFTASLNLKDTWVYFNPTAKEFTFSENEISSRLDMFLMPEDIIERVNHVKICKSKRIQDSKSNANQRNISDHEPLVLILTLNKQTRKKHIPNVASWLEKYTYSRDERTGMINGAEILYVIKSLTDSGQQYCDGIYVQTYKNLCCPLSEILKEYFNHLLKCKKISESFKEHNFLVRDSRKIFNVDYMIFTMILAKRLKTLLMASLDNNSQANMSDCFSVAFSEKPTHIRWTFLKKCLIYLRNTCKSTKHIHSRDFNTLEGLVHGTADSTEDFSILESILPKSSNTSEDVRALHEGCPLTRVILSLVLKYLEIFTKEKGYITSICPYRQVLVICCLMDFEETSTEDLSLWEEFREDSGIRMRISKIN